MDKEMTFEEWTKCVPARLKSDPLWESAYYRFAMYLYDLAWIDCDLLKRDYRGREIVGQLVRSAGSICANMEEAYGRGIGSADYIRIMRIALGEARETQGWYYRSRFILSPETIDQRISIIAQVIALLVNSISFHRKTLDKR